MANIPQKSITYPGLSDTYTFVQLDNTLSEQGKAADAKATGDAISELESDTAEEFNAIKGKAVELTTGDYWGGIKIGTSMESSLTYSSSSYGKHTMVSLPAGKTLRIVTKSVTINGGIVDTLIQNYFAFNADTGLCIDVPPLPPAKDTIFTYYLRYDVDAHVYINCLPSFDGFVAIVDESTPYVDLSKTIGVTQPTIMEANNEKELCHAIKSLKWKQKGANTAPVALVHFSDLHDDGENLKRLVDFVNDPKVKKSIDGVFCSGDIVYNTLTDGMEFFSNVDGSENIMLVPGNHDCVKKPESSIVNATPSETYAALLADRISNWAVTQPENAATNGLCYYYKDYATQKLRVIFLDGSTHGDSSYVEAEATWLVTVLDDAEELGYSVVCVDHYPFKPNSYTMLNCSFTPRYNFNQPAGYLPDSFVNAVETFITGGGDFVCWIAGHWHQDYVMLHNDGHQLCVGVSCATHEDRSNLNISYCDEYREPFTKSQDLFNVVGIDTSSKNVSILRVGADITRLMNSKRHLCLNYATRTVVWND